jgi:hypothetical protein
VSREKWKLKKKEKISGVDNHIKTIDLFLFRKLDSGMSNNLRVSHKEMEIKKFLLVRKRL